MRVIYALIDPRDGSVRYVGKSKRGLWPRVWQHRCDQTRTKRGAWIRKLRTLGLAFSPVILEQDPDDLDEAEKFWIAVYRQVAGNRLTNMTDGGEGGATPSAATREKMRQALKGRIFSPEHCARISAAKKGQGLGRPSSNRGRVFSIEWRAKLSAAKIGNKNRLGAQSVV